MLRGENGAGLRGHLVGRRDERDALSRLLDQAAGGSGGTAVLEGEAGIGKSTLADAVAAVAVHRGFSVLRGAARELEQERPFGSLVEALDAVREADAVRLADVLRHPSSTAFSAGDEIADRLEELASAVPTLLILEDLHWADPATAQALPRLARLADTLPLCLVLTLRPAPAASHVAVALRALAAATRLPLGPLGGDDLRELASAVLGSAPSDVDLDRLARAGGNPLFAVELLRSHEHHDELIPPSLRMVLLDRVRTLPERSLEALRVASVLGSTFHPHELALLLDIPVPDVVIILLPALDGGVLEDVDAGRLRFRHDLLRDAVYEDLPQSLRTSLHGHAARLLASAGARAIDVARHVALGAVPGDPAAVDLLVSAAQQSRPTAPAVAVDLLRRALELTDPLSGRQAQVRAELAVALRTAGRGVESAQHARAALRSTTLPPERRYALVQSVCESLMLSGRTNEVLAVAEAGLRDAASTPEEKSVYAGYAWFVRVVHLGEDRHDKRWLVEQAFASGVGEDDPFVRTFTAFGRALVALWTADVAEAATQLQVAQQHAEASLLWREVIQIRGMRAVLLSWTDRVDDALLEVAEARRVRQQLGDEAPTTRTTLLPLLVSGQWSQLSAELTARHQQAVDAGVQPNAADLAMRAFLLTKAGDPAAEREVAAAEEAATRLGPQVSVHFVLWAQSLLARRASAAAGADVIRQRLLPRGQDPYAIRLIGPDAVRIALAARDEDLADELLPLLEDVCARLGSVSARAAAVGCRALRTDDTERLLEAVRLYRTTPARLDERAAALEDAARSLASSSPEESRVLAAEAAELYDRLGAAADVRRVSTLLPTGGARSRPVTGWGSLTDSERRVVELLARGLRNKQIAAELWISARTVETHVSRALQKMQASSRVELAARALDELARA